MRLCETKMNVLFISISGIPALDGHSISLDLIRQFKENGHNVFVVGSNERRTGLETSLSNECGCRVLRVKVGNNKNTNIIEKGISNLLLPYQYTAAIKKHFKGVKFDLVLYPTPPVTQVKTVQYIKKRDNAKTYLLLKDIFPQNAVDIGMMRKSGIKSVIYKMFRKKEEKLYKISDFIGCMSGANVDYLLKHNPYINPQKVHINPNSIEVLQSEISDEKKAEIKAQYNIPENATTFIYGGNLGRPQGIPFVIECLRANAQKKDRFFIVCGKGTEYPKLQKFIQEEKPDNVLLINGLPKEEYEEFVKAFDVGLIFLDHRFTIPNFPSRLLSYMQNKMPTLACTDCNTDIGKVITEGGFGWWCESNSVEDFCRTVDAVCASPFGEMGQKAYQFLLENYTSEKAYNTIIEKIQ